jgi:PAS domain-containing protein
MDIKIKAPRIPWLFSLIVLAVAVGILGLGYYAFKNTEAEAFTEYNRRQLMIARAAADGLNSSFNHLRNELHTLRGLVNMEGLAPETLYRITGHLYNELKSWGIKCICLLDADGKSLYSTGAPDLENRDYCGEELIKRLSNHEAPRVEGGDIPYAAGVIDCRGVNTGRQALQMAMPVKKDGRLKGYVFCCQWMNFLTSKFVAWAHNTAGGHTFLIDRQYRVLWAPDLSFIGKNLMKEAEGYPELQRLLREFSAGKPGAGEYTFRAYDGSRGRFTDREEEVLAAYQPVKAENEQWMVVAWSSKESARQSIQAVYNRQLILVILSILVIAGAYIYALTLYSRISRKLEREVKRKTGQLEESHRRLLTILENINASVYAADTRDHEILFANKYLRDIYGEIEGKKCWQVFHREESGPCSFCSNPELVANENGNDNGAADESVSTRAFHNTALGLWHERRAQAIRWVDGSMVRLEIAMDTPCQHLEGEKIEGKKERR